MKAIRKPTSLKVSKKKKQKWRNPLVSVFSYVYFCLSSRCHREILEYKEEERNDTERK